MFVIANNCCIRQVSINKGSYLVRKLKPQEHSKNMTEEKPRGTRLWRTLDETHYCDQFLHWLHSAGHIVSEVKNVDWVI